MINKKQLKYIKFCFLMLKFNQLNGFGIDAKSEFAWWRTIGKNMSKMSITHITHHFYANHSYWCVFYIFDHIVFYRFGKAWPSWFAFEFNGRIKQGGITTYASIVPFIINMTQCTGKGGLRSFFPGNPKLFRSQLYLPFFLCFSYIIFRFRSSMVSKN